MVLGDLQEQLPKRGRAWYWREALAIAAHALTRRSSIDDSATRRGDFFMSTWLTDIRYACRSLRKRPLLTATITMTLALGLGANAAIFNLIDRMVLRPYPLVDPDPAKYHWFLGTGMAHGLRLRECRDVLHRNTERAASFPQREKKINLDLPVKPSPQQWQQPFPLLPQRTCQRDWPREPASKAFLDQPSDAGRLVVRQWRASRRGPAE